MTKAERRIACAEELGWKWSKPNEMGYRCWIAPNGRPVEGFMLPDPESSLNDCKPLIEMANNRGVEFELQTASLINKVFAIFISRDDSFKGVSILCTPESAIVEAFLKWKGKL